jgi:hypothetical protein
MMYWFVLLVSFVCLPQTSYAQDTLEVLSASSLSPTEVRLVFSHPVSLDPKRAQNAFSIVNTKGKSLLLTKMVIKNTEVTLHTFPQKKGDIYALYVNPIVYAQLPNTVLLIDPKKNMTSFAAHKDSLENIHTISMKNVHLEHTKREDGLFDIDVSWEISGDTTDIDHYVIYQNHDKEGEVSMPQILSSHLTSVRIEGVPDGEFGVIMEVVQHDGTSFKNDPLHVDLQKEKEVIVDTTSLDNPLIANILSQEEDITVAMSTRDIGMIVFVMIGGAIIGWLGVRVFH